MASFDDQAAAKQARAAKSLEATRKDRLRQTTPEQRARDWARSAEQTRAKSIQAEYDSRPEPKFRKGQEATIKGQRGSITDVMWDRTKKTWDYTIQCYVSASEAEVKP